MVPFQCVIVMSSESDSPYEHPACNKRKTDRKHA